MERFVQLVTGGGLALVAGLWAVSLSATGSGPWLLGAGLVIVGTGALLAGIGTEVDLGEW